MEDIETLELGCHGQKLSEQRHLSFRRKATTLRPSWTNVMAVMVLVAAELIGHLKHEQMPVKSINRDRKRENSHFFTPDSDIAM